MGSEITTPKLMEFLRALAATVDDNTSLRAQLDEERRFRAEAEKAADYLSSALMRANETITQLSAQVEAMEGAEDVRPHEAPGGGPAPSPAG